MHCKVQVRMQNSRAHEIFKEDFAGGVGLICLMQALWRMCKVSADFMAETGDKAQHGSY